MDILPRPPFDTRSPAHEHEKARLSPWMQRDVGYHNHRNARSSDTMDPESEDSDISMDGSETGAALFPINLPPAPSKQNLDNQDSVAAYLADMERIENHNIQKHNQLKARRARMDERILAKRTAQDAKIRAIMDARARRDSRIKQRRDREDVAFQRFYDMLEEEETHLRKRLKALKRGLAAEDGQPDSRRVSLNAASPSASTFSVIPPPAKRHQTSHPSHPEQPSIMHSTDAQAYSQPPSDRPTHQFYQYPPAAHPPPPPAVSAPPAHFNSHGASPYGRDTYRSSGPPEHSPRANHLPSPRLSDPGPYPGRSSVPRDSAVHQPTPPAHTYDTRPPPSAPSQPSGFAAINNPSPSGFAAVNAGYSTAQHPVESREPERKSNSGPPRGPPSRNSTEEDGKTAGSASKRTPSTTHPYQMSEAFANRHHHCEDIDGLNRGIWTWYGHSGTQDRPTAPATRMYLKCNHDSCGRIDWRTVHGLQCHIVKNHEQPKGTIGSLEKALAAYGVPVAEIEEYESHHGIGTGGTMGDPKSIKLRAAKQREASEKKSQIVRPATPVAAAVRSDTRPAAPINATPPAVAQTRTDAKTADKPAPAHSSVDADEQFRPKSGGFAAINTFPQHPRPVSSHSIAHIISPPINDKEKEPDNRGGADTFWNSWKASSNPSLPETPKPRELKSAAASPHLAQKHTNPSGAGTEPGPRRGSKITDPAVQKFIDATFAKDTAGGNQQPVLDMNKKDIEMKEAGPPPPATKEAGEQTPMPLPAPSTAVQAMPESMLQDRVALANEVDDKDDHHYEAEQRPYRAVTPDVVKDTIMAGAETPPASEDKQLKSAMQSPETSNRRIIPPRRTSRRASIAISNSLKAAREAQDEDLELVSGATTASKTNSVADDEHDSITVNMEAREAVKAEKEREKDDDRSKPSTPARRLANGRFSKRSR